MSEFFGGFKSERESDCFRKRLAPYCRQIYTVFFDEFHDDFFAVENFLLKIGIEYRHFIFDKFKCFFHCICAMADFVFEFI